MFKITYVTQFIFLLNSPGLLAIIDMHVFIFLFSLMAVEFME